MPLNVLVVDDSAVMRAMIARVVRLTGLPVAGVLEAGDGAAGLAALRDHRVDLVLLDVNMPVMDGEAMLRRLRADPATAGLPVIVVSTEGSDTRVAALGGLGAAFVHKPFAPEDLRATILRITGTPDDDQHAAPAAPGGDIDF